jgi:hypothetical protein
MKKHTFVRYGTCLVASITLLICTSLFANWGSLEEGLFHRVYFKDKPMAIKALQLFEAEAYEVSWEEKYHVMKLTPEAVETLEGLDFIVEPYLNYNMYHSRTDKRYPASPTYDGIPGYPSYLLVEETFHYCDSLTKAFPKLFDWVDVGDSWEKTQGSGGYDHMVIILTNKDIAGPKPKLFLGGSIHAREYTTSELNRRFLKYCIENYGKDADVTWLVDYHELHVMHYINPDGRKHAEDGESWRKNTNTDYCPEQPRYRGVDLNRNADASWAGGNDECSQTYPGPRAASEPEMQVLQAYMDDIFKTTEVKGMYIDMHSYGEIIYKPSAMTTLARKFTYFNGYDAIASRPGLAYHYAYSEAGAAAACLFELGTSFFQNCDYFENTIAPDNLPALLYAFKACRDPINIALGPDAIDLAVNGKKLTATIDDTRYGQSVSSQNIEEAEFYIGKPPWVSGATATKMTAVDGNFNSTVEDVEGTLPKDFPSSKEETIIFMRGKDTDDKWGALSAIFADVVHINQDPIMLLGTKTEFTFSRPLRIPATINLSIPKDSDVSFKVYNISGKEIATLINTRMKAGYHPVVWDGTDNAGNQLAGGVYLFQMVTDNSIQSERFVIVK